jgi:hypothetical protein
MRLANSHNAVPWRPKAMSVWLSWGDERRTHNAAAKNAHAVATAQ